MPAEAQQSADAAGCLPACSASFSVAPSIQLPNPCASSFARMQKQSKAQKKREQRQREDVEREARIAAELAELGDTGGGGRAGTCVWTPLRGSTPACG